MITSSIARLVPALGATAALVLGAVSPASASSTTKADPEGDVFLSELGGGMDLAAVRLETDENRKRIRVTFRLHEPVLESSLERPGGLSVTFVTAKGTSRVVTVSTVDGRLRGTVCRDTTADTRGLRDCRRLAATQVDETTYSTVVGLARIEKDATVLRWTASSLDLTSGSPVSDRLTARKNKPFRWRL